MLLVGPPGTSSLLFYYRSVGERLLRGTVEEQGDLLRSRYRYFDCHLGLSFWASVEAQKSANCLCTLLMRKADRRS